MTLASKIISGLLAFLMFHSPAFGFGGNKTENNTADGKTVTVTVAQDGSGDYATLDEARDYVRTLDRSKYSGIDVVIKGGKYQAQEMFKLTAEDSGTETCPIRYIGEGDARLYGGVAFTAADFEPLGDGEVVQYFPEEVKDKLVQIDLKQFGYEADDVHSLIRGGWNGGIVPLYVNGKKMDVARFPNAGDGMDSWLRVAGGGLYPEYSEDRPWSADTDADYVIIEYDAQYDERIRSWHDINNIEVGGRFTFLWCLDFTQIHHLEEDAPRMWCYFAGGYEPKKDFIFYFYYIPEELDAPGEYYIDDDLILYYYPTEDHETAVYSMPQMNENIIALDGAEYITLENIAIDTARRDAISGKADHFTIKDCEIRGVLGTGIKLDGTHITVERNTLDNIGAEGINIVGGDMETLTSSHNLIKNNSVSNWSTRVGVMQFGISVNGVGNVISHNEVFDSVDWGIAHDGAYNIVEYNYIHDTSSLQDDNGVLFTSRAWGSIVRYNFLETAGIRDKALNFVGVGGIAEDHTDGCCMEVYGNIIYDISGASFFGCVDWGTKLHDNIIVAPGRYAAFFMDTALADANLYGDYTISSSRLPDYCFSETWLEAFPFLKTLKTTVTAEDIEEIDAEEDGDLWLVPRNGEVYNNYLFYDKASTMIPEKGVPIYDIKDMWKPFYTRFDDMPYTQYSSSRGKGHPSIEEIIETASGTTNITMEDFNKIGIEK